MKSKKKRNPFDLDIKPTRISKYRINPRLLEIIADRRRRRRGLLITKSMVMFLGQSSLKKR